MKRPIGILAGVALSVLLSGQAQAQSADAAAKPATGGIQEIVVTAQKRSENVQNVPIAISAFTASALKERAVTSVADLSNLAPNVTLTAGTPFSGAGTVLSAYIRGIGSNDFAFNIDPGVGIYLDGVYLARSVGANQDLPDVERIEVLKGPQGTLFGRNTIGGALSIVTHDPGKVFRFSGDATTGSYNLVQVKGTVDLPVTKDLSASISFSTKNRDGYLHRIAYPGFNAGNANISNTNSFVAAGYGGQGVGGTEGSDGTWSTRGKLKWDNGGTFKAVLSADYTYVSQQQQANKLIATTENVPGPFAGLNANDLGPNEGFPLQTGLDVITGSSGFLFGGLYNFCVTATPDQIAARNAGNLCGPRAGVNGYKAQPGLAGSGAPTYGGQFVTNSMYTSYATGNNFSREKDYGGNLTLTDEVSKDLTIKSITAYRELNWIAATDLDGSPLEMLNTSFTETQKQFSQEVQLLGTALDSKLHYVVGGYYFYESGTIHDYVTFADGLLQVNGPNELATRNEAGFAQMDYRPSDLIGITLGARYTHESKQFEGGQSDLNGFNYDLFNCQTVGADGLPTAACAGLVGFSNPAQPLRYYVTAVNHQSFNNFSPKIGVQIHPTSDAMIYGSFSQGYKTGGWTTRLSNPLPTAQSFGPEKATTFEIGAKSVWFDRKLQLNAAAFHTFYKGIQLNFQQGVSPTIQNAGNAKIDGFEIEAVIAPAQGLTINSAVGYLDAKYSSVLPQAVVNPSPYQTGVYVGATLPATPKLKFNISPRYEADLGGHGTLVFLADYTHSSSIKNDTEGTFLLIRQAMSMLNGSITYKEPGNHWELTVGGTNLTNTHYYTNGQAQIAGGEIYGTPNRPAEWYAKIGFKF